jgi:hypothetical protein
MTIVHEELTEAVLDEIGAEASNDAIQELQRLGIDIFYAEDNMHVLEHSDGSRFRIEFTHEQPGAYRVLHPLNRLS